MLTVKKAVRYVLAGLAIICINFFIPRAMPGDPVHYILGEDIGVDSDQITEIKHELGLDLPLHRQFSRYLGRLARLDLGYSHTYHRQVSDIIGSRLRWTLLLAIPSILIGAIAGSIGGAVAGFYPSKPGSRFVTAAAMTLHSAPPFFLAILLLYLFSFKLGWFPLKGYYSTGGFLDIVSHVALPTLVLSLFTSVRNLMIMRGSVLQERRRHYVTFYRAKGLSESKVLFCHVLPNASLPLLTMISLDFGFVLSGALFVEIVFSMNGMGTLIYDSVSTRDYPVLQGSFFVIAFMVLAANLLADILYGALDPQVRRAG